MSSLVAEGQGSEQFFVRLEQGEACVSLFDERWDALARRQQLPNPTLSATWLTHLVEWESGTPVAVVVEQDGAFVAGGAFGLYRPAGRFGPTVARWLGDHRQWFSCDLVVDPLTPKAGRVALDALLGIADGVHLPAPKHGPAAAAIAACAPWRKELPGAEGWTTAIPPPRLARVARVFEKDCRRARRRGVEVSTQVSTDRKDVLAALERLFRLHAERWRSRGGEIPRFSTTERHRSWYRRVVAAMAERGQVVIAAVLEDGAEVGMDLGFVAGSGAVAHTCTIRAGGRLDEPGHASQLVLLLALEERGVEGLDLGLGAGEAGGLKASLGATRMIVKRFVGATSRRRQLGLEAALACRDILRGRSRGSGGAQS